MKVAVTGGSGVVGAAVSRHLVDAGHEVRGLARSAAAAATLRSMGVDPIPGDLLDTGSVDRLVAGCEVVFHIAGVNEMCSRDPARMWRVNVEGSLVVLEASERAGARRLVHTSSAVTIGEEQGTVGSELSPHRGYFLSEYERSKTVAEQLVLGNNHDVEVVSVNPSSVQGPGRTTGTGALFTAAVKGTLPVAVNATFSLIDIDDCARGHLLAAERGLPGERYIVSGPVTTVREALAQMNRRMGRRGSPWFIRPAVLEATAPGVDAVLRLLGRPSPLCPESARVLLSGHRYDGSKAARELGLEYTSLPDTINRTIDWLRS